MKKKKIVEALSVLPREELINLVRTVFLETRIKKTFENGDFEIEDALCVAECSYGAFNGKTDDSVLVELVAFPSDSSYKNKLLPITEQGICGACNTPVVCESKQAICPICDFLVDCT